MHRLENSCGKRVGSSRRKFLSLILVMPFFSAASKNAYAFLPLLGRALIGLARSGARAGVSRRAAVSSVGAGTSLYSGRSALARSRPYSQGNKGRVRHGGSSSTGRSRYDKRSYTEKERERREVRDAVEAVPNLSSRDRIRMTRNLLDLMEVLQTAQDRELVNHIISAWGSREKTDFSHAEHCGMCPSVYAHLTNGTSLSGYYNDSTSDLRSSAYQKPIDEIVVRSTYRPARSKRHYFPRKYAHSLKCKGKTTLSCEFDFEGKNMQDVAYYVENAMTSSINSNKVDVSCDIKRGKSLACRMTGDIGSFDKRKMRKILFGR